MMRRFVCAIAWACALGATAEPIVVPASVPYSEDADVQQKIRVECTELERQFATFIQEFARQRGVEVVEGDVAANTGRVLRVRITNAVSTGNAFIGHAKSSSARGTLYENGVAVASFRARRNSMGGMFAGYKGSCSVLGRTVRAMGEDIAGWLANPVDGAELGDR